MGVRSEPLHNGRLIARRAPVGLVLTTALAALILVGAVVAWLGWQFSLLNPTIASVLRTAIYAIPLLLVSAAGLVGLRIAWRRWGSHEYIRADKVTALTRAQRQTFPSSLTSL